jgi:putative oxidoreductase
MNREKNIEWAVFLLRVVAGFLFMEYGGMKLFGWFSDSTFNDLPTLMKVAGALEFFGGIAMMLGLWVRPIAFILAGEMAVAYFMAHAAQGYWYAPAVNDGSASVLFCFIFLFFAAYGAGKCSLGKNG